MLELHTHTATYVSLMLNQTTLYLQHSKLSNKHYSDVIMGAMAQMTGASIVYSNICSGADQRKHQSSAPLAFLGEFTSDR